MLRLRGACGRDCRRYLLLLGILAEGLLELDRGHLLVLRIREAVIGIDGGVHTSGGRHHVSGDGPVPLRRYIDRP